MPRSATARSVKRARLRDAGLDASLATNETGVPPVKKTRPPRAKKSK